MRRKQSKITGVIFIFVLLTLSMVGQDLKITTNIPENLNAGQSYDVDINISKGSVSSFAKFQMDLPFGYTATSIDAKTGNWSFDNQRAKIVWVSVPNDPQFTVKVKMNVPSNAAASATITGKFFYLESNVKKEYDLPPITVRVSGGSGVATNTVTTNTVTTNTVTTNTVTTNTVTTNTVAATNTTTTNPETNAGVTYRVQIGAFSIKPGKAKFPGVKDFWIYEDNGLYKATAGKFNNLDAAEAYKAQLKSQGMDGFVVAFQNGVRVKLR
jgi:hypothetical protein